MSKSRIADRLATGTGLNRAVAKDAVDNLFRTNADAPARGDEVRIAGSGAFVTRNWAARTARSPQRGELLMIPATKTPSFKSGKALRDMANDEYRQRAGNRRRSRQPTPPSSRMPQPLYRIRTAG